MRLLFAGMMTVLILCLFAARAEAGFPSLRSSHAYAEVTPEDFSQAKREKRNEDTFVNEVSRHCARHYASVIQGELRTACGSAAEEFKETGKTLVQTRCRLDHGEDPRLVMACLVGAAISDDLAAGRDDFKRRLQLCAEHYPVHTEIDAFLLESCLTGVHLPLVMNVQNKSRQAACAEITPERSFIGPCSVGLTLGQDPGAVGPQLNRLCEQYFDHKKFHAGYRACLTARSLGPKLPENVTDVIRICGDIVAEPKNNTERAACVVGASLFRNIGRESEVTKRLQKCGDNKVSYQDRDFLACLTAAGLTQWTDRSGADAACREIYASDTKTSRGRSDCQKSIGLF